MYDLKTSKEKQTSHTPVNKTGIPSPLKENIEKSHNLSLDNVHVHLVIALFVQAKTQKTTCNRVILYNAFFMM